MGRRGGNKRSKKGCVCQHRDSNESVSPEFIAESPLYQRELDIFRSSSPDTIFPEKDIPKINCAILRAISDWPNEWSSTYVSRVVANNRRGGTFEQFAAASVTCRHMS